MNTPSPSTLDLGVGGMTCASCVSRVEKALKKVPGVQDATVNLATESARITFAPSAQAEALLRRAVRDAGYEPRSPEAVMEHDVSPWAGFAPVAIGLLLSAPLVLPMVGDLFGRHWMLPAWLQFAAGHAGAVHPGCALLQGRLACPARTAAATWTCWWPWAPAPAGVCRCGCGWPAEAHAAHGMVPHLYFEASAVVVTLVLLGKWLEARAKRQTTQAIRALHACDPTWPMMLRRRR
jgi:Cu+-exporting ATPase